MHAACQNQDKETNLEVCLDERPQQAELLLQRTAHTRLQPGTYAGMKNFVSHTKTIDKVQVMHSDLHAEVLADSTMSSSHEGMQFIRHTLHMRDKSDRPISNPVTATSHMNAM